MMRLVAHSYKNTHKDMYVQQYVWYAHILNNLEICMLYECMISGLGYWSETTTQCE